MSRRLLLILGLITAGAVMLAILTGRDRPDPEASGAAAELVPGLSHAINQVERIRLTAPEGDGVITIVRNRDGWSVSERDGYPVDAGQVRQLLIRLSEARTLEEKTADPGFYDRLGVEDVTEETGSGVLVEIEGGADAALIVGKQEPRSGRGTYVRPRDSAGSLLDMAGVKGISEGTAQFSPVHANFIVNRGGATADQVLRLMRRGRDAVRNASGIDLKPEIHHIRHSQGLGQKLGVLSLDDPDAAGGFKGCVRCLEPGLGEQRALADRGEHTAGAFLRRL